VLQGVLEHVPRHVRGAPHGRLPGRVEPLPHADLHHVQRRLDHQDLGPDHRTQVYAVACLALCLRALMECLSSCLMMLLSLYHSLQLTWSPTCDQSDIIHCVSKKNLSPFCFLE